MQRTARYKLSELLFAMHITWSELGIKIRQKISERFVFQNGVLRIVT